MSICSIRIFSSNEKFFSKAVPDKLYKKIELELRGHDKAVLKSYGEFTDMTANHLGITITKKYTFFYFII